MLSCLFQMFSLVVNLQNIIIQSQLLYVDLNTLLIYFSINYPKILMLNQIITVHNSICNLFGSGIYHKHHSIFKSKSYEFRKSNIGLVSGNDISMAGYLVIMNRDLGVRKVLLAKFSSTEFSSMIINSKFSKVLSYIHNHNAWERCYVLLKILFPCFGFFIWKIVTSKGWKMYTTIP